MSASTLESMALDMFDEEYEREAAHAARRRRMRHSFGGHVEVCPVVWVMHELVQLVEENHTVPVEQLRPCIRRLIAEKAFAFGTRDDTDPEKALDQEVDLIVRALERVREHAFASGHWSSMECTPEMFVG